MAAPSGSSRSVRAPPPAPGRVSGAATEPRPAPPVEEIRAKVVLVGDSGVGKTSLVRRWVSDAFTSDYVATLGVVLARRAVDVVLGDGAVRVALVLWDTMGERAIADALREAYLHDAGGVLVICDGSSPASAASVPGWLGAARRVAGSAPRAVVLNKSDLGGERRGAARRPRRRGALLPDEREERGQRPPRVRRPRAPDRRRRAAGRAVRPRVDGHRDRRVRAAPEPRGPQPVRPLSRGRDPRPGGRPRPPQLPPDR